MRQHYTEETVQVRISRFEISRSSLSPRNTLLTDLGNIAHLKQNCVTAVFYFTISSRFWVPEPGGGGGGGRSLFRGRRHRPTRYKKTLRRLLGCWNCHQGGRRGENFIFPPSSRKKAYECNTKAHTQKVYSLAQKPLYRIESVCLVNTSIAINICH
jgi:hypothetical protein